LVERLEIKGSGSGFERSERSGYPMPQGFIRTDGLAEHKYCITDRSRGVPPLQRLVLYNNCGLLPGRVRCRYHTVVRELVSGNTGNEKVLVSAVVGSSSNPAVVATLIPAIYALRGLRK